MNLSHLEIGKKLESADIIVVSEFEKLLKVAGLEELNSLPEVQKNDNQTHVVKYDGLMPGGLFEGSKLGSSDLIIVGRFKGINLDLSGPYTEGTTTEASVDMLVVNAYYWCSHYILSLILTANTTCDSAVR